MEKDKVWLITGSSRGLGRAISEVALKKGYKVVATARRLESIGDLVEQNPENSCAVRLDVTNQAEIKAAVDAAIARFGRIDVLVNNAGYGLLGAVEEPSEEQIRSQFETNLFGAVKMMRAVLPKMRIRRSGHIVNISSVLGFVSRASAGYYSATKFALEALSESLAEETAGLGIRVTIVEPGPFRTDFAGRSLQLPAGLLPEVYPTTRAIINYMSEVNGRQEGDPYKAADVIIRAVESDSPPLRLPLGATAFARIEEKLSSVRSGTEPWRDAAVKTDFDEEKSTSIGVRQ